MQFRAHDKYALHLSKMEKVLLSVAFIQVRRNKQLILHGYRSITIDPLIMKSDGLIYTLVCMSYQKKEIIEIDNQIKRIDVACQSENLHSSFVNTEGIS